MRIVLTILVVLAGIVALQLAGVAIIAPSALAAQYALEGLVSCCGEPVAIAVAPVVFLGLIAAIWYVIATVQNKRWQRRIREPLAGK